MGKFVMKQTKTGVKFDLKAGNGEIIATSEVYSSESACRAGIASVAKNAPIANVENQTVEGFAVGRRVQIPSEGHQWPDHRCQRRL